MAEWKTDFIVHQSSTSFQYIVPDLETKELMIAFYKNIKGGKGNRCKTFIEAALEQMAVSKRRYGSDNLLSWGAFVFLGEP